jgi:hypothetical protein
MKSGKTRHVLVSFTSILSSIILLFLNGIGPHDAFRGALKMNMIMVLPLRLERVFG